MPVRYRPSHGVGRKHSVVEWEPRETELLLVAFYCASDPTVRRQEDVDRDLRRLAAACQAFPADPQQVRDDVRPLLAACRSLVSNPRLEGARGIVEAARFDLLAERRPPAPDLPLPKVWWTERDDD